MVFPTTLIQKLKISQIKLNITDNTLNHNQSNLYYKKKFHSNYKIDEHILKNIQKKSPNQDEKWNL